VPDSIQPDDVLKAYERQLKDALRGNRKPFTTTESIERP